MGKQGHTAMPLIILMWKNLLAKVRRIYKLRAQNFQFFFVQNSDNPRYIAPVSEKCFIFTLIKGIMVHVHEFK